MKIKLNYVFIVTCSYRRMLRENVSSSLIEDQKKKKEKDSI